MAPHPSRRGVTFSRMVGRPSRYAKRACRQNDRPFLGAPSNEVGRGRAPVCQKRASTSEAVASSRLAHRGSPLTRTP